MLLGLCVLAGLSRMVHEAPDDASTLRDRVQEPSAEFTDDLLLAGVVANVVEQRITPDEVGLMPLDQNFRCSSELGTAVNGVAIKDQVLRARRCAPG